MRYKYLNIIEIISILFVVWLTFIFMLLFIDIYIVPLQLPLVDYVGRVIIGVTKVIIGVGLFVLWLFLWNYIVKKYFKKAINTIQREENRESGNLS